MTTSAWPCDSPAVRKRSIGSPRLLAAAGGHPPPCASAAGRAPSSRSAAARITARVGLHAGPAVELQRPPGGRACRGRRSGARPAARRPAAGPSRAGGTRGRRRPARACSSDGIERDAARRRAPMPTDVALTTRSASPTSSSVADPPGVTGERRRLLGRAAVRLTTPIGAAPARASASTTARAAPPAPSTTTRSPAGSTRGVAAAASRRSRRRRCSCPTQPAVGATAPRC